MKSRQWMKWAVPLGLVIGLALCLGPVGLGQEKKEPPKGGKAPLKTGLNLNDPKAFQGYTLFSPLNSTKYYLIDMEGKVARQWEGATRPAGCVYLLENGNLLRQCVSDKKTPFGTGGGGGGRVQEF